MAIPGRATGTRRWSSRFGTAAVAIIAAIASYSHMRGLAIRHGQDSLIATLLPLSVDGLVVVAAVAVGDGRRHTWSAWLSFWLGVGASVIANVLAAQPGIISRAISAWPAVALLAVVEVLSRSEPRRQPAQSSRDTVQDTLVATATSENAASPDTAWDTPSALNPAIPDRDADASSRASVLPQSA